MHISDEYIKIDLKILHFYLNLLMDGGEMSTLISFFKNKTNSILYLLGLLRFLIGLLLSSITIIIIVLFNVKIRFFNYL